MKSFVRLLVIAAVVGGIAAQSSSAHSTFIIRRVVFVAISGHGSVTSVPKGIVCPGVCRSNHFVKEQLVKLVAHPAPGWALARFSGSCSSKKTTCSFWLTDSHDCAGGMCPIGAFGERIAFVRQSGQ